MPVYEYLCGKCGHEFEREQRITEDPVKSCPKCRARKVRRLISKTAFVLKGSGWYSDLYSSPKPEKKGSDGGDESSAPATSDSGGDKTTGGDKASPDKKPGTKDSKKKSKGKSTKAA